MTEEREVYITIHDRNGEEEVSFIEEAGIAELLDADVVFVFPDHIHLIATLPKGMTDEKVMQLLKG